MDSMRSLNTSLPRTTPRRQNANQQPPEDLLSAFRSAALSVTTLYKTAATDQVRARAAGYQDALDDLLSFLDKENLGLGDGEGWRVRQWATERLDGTTVNKGESSEEEDEPIEEEKAPSAAPEASKHDTSSPPQQEQPTQQSPETITRVTPHIHQQRTHHEPAHAPPSSSFTFRSSYQYPSSNHDREGSTDDRMNTSETSSQAEQPVRIEVVSRPRHRNNKSTRPSGNGRASLGSGAGAKRKVPFGDFFDISGLSFDNNNNNNNSNNHKDGQDRGGKRGRHV